MNALQVRPVSSAEEWNRQLSEFPRAHVLQTWEWGEFKARYGWQPARLLLCDGERPVAAVQVLRRNIPRLPFGILYAPRGPALDYSRPDLLAATLQALEAYARREHAIFVKIDPDLPREAPAAAVLDRRGWRSSDEQIQFRNTVVLDLEKSEDELLAAMKPKWRYNIRLAAKRGVTVAAGGVDDLPAFYRMYAETSERDGFLIRLYPYYERIWTSFLRAGLGHLLLARAEGELVGGILLFTFARRAWYFYGASRSLYRDRMPNHLLQWEAIRWARAQGCIEYDFWGAPDKIDANDPMQGVYNFKMGFGGRLVETVGARDYVVDRALDVLYSRVRPWYLERLRRRHHVTATVEPG